MAEPLRHTISYRVPYADTDQMQVVYYANYLVYFERIRNELLRASGLTYREVEAQGYALPVREAHVSYHAPATYDDLLTITGWCTALKGARLTLSYTVHCGDKLLAEGYTLHAFVNKSTLRPTRPTPAFSAALGFA